MEERAAALIVDDEKDVCFLLGSILKHKNLHSRWVNSLTEAREILATEAFSIVFLDNHLPDGFGMNFVTEMKGMQPHAKIVMITAHDTKADQERAYREGVDLFVGKPFTRNDILAAVDDLIEENHLKL